MSPRLSDKFIKKWEVRGVQSMSRLRSWLLGTTIATASVLLTLVLAEVFLRLFAPQPLNLYNFALLNEQGMVVKAAGHWTGGSFYRTDLKPPGQGPMQPNKRLRFGYIDIEVNEHGWSDRWYTLRVAQVN